MGVIYSVSIIAILIIFMLIKKSDKKLNGLGILGLGIVLILCYNVFECYILNFLRIKLTLLNLSIVNFVLIILGGIYLFKKKEIQKYYLNTYDLIFVFLIAIIVFFIGAFHYGNSLTIVYESTDPAVHYTAAVDFANSDHLFNLEGDELWGMQNWKLGSFVNSGLIMKIFSNVIDVFYNYKIFIAFGLFTLFLTAYIMYMAFVKISKGKLQVLAFIVSLLYVLGYPLNSLLFGFEYMSMGILVVTALLYAVQFYTSKEINLKQIIVILFLLNFQLFHSYYQFIPYIYSALFIYICFVNYKEDKKIFSKKNIITLLVTLILPFILGYIYYMAQGIYNLDFLNSSIATEVEDSIEGQEQLISSFKTPGYVYNNLYSNIIILLPLVIYVIIKEIREKKSIDFSSIAVIFTLGYIILLVIGNIMDYVSDYYVTKNYFALWILLWYINFKGLYYLYEKKKLIPYLIVVVYVVILVISSFNFSIKNVSNRLKDYRFTGFAELYNVNRALTLQAGIDFYDQEMELMKYARDNLDKNKKIELLGTEQQIIWAYKLLDYYYSYPEMGEQWFQKKLTYKHMNGEIIDNADYVICFYRTSFYKEYDKTLLENKEVVYENSFGKIVKVN